MIKVFNCEGCGRETSSPWITARYCSERCCRKVQRKRRFLRDPNKYRAVRAAQRKKYYEKHREKILHYQIMHRQRYRQLYRERYRGRYSKSKILYCVICNVQLPKFHRKYCSKACAKSDPARAKRFCCVCKKPLLGLNAIRVTCNAMSCRQSFRREQNYKARKSRTYYRRKERWRASAIKQAMRNMGLLPAKKMSTNPKAALLRECARKYNREKRQSSLQFRRQMNKNKNARRKKDRILIAAFLNLMSIPPQHGSLINDNA